MRLREGHKYKEVAILEKKTEKHVFMPLAKVKYWIKKFCIIKE